MAKLLHKFDSSIDGDYTNIICIYDDCTYSAERLGNRGRSEWKIEDETTLYYRHPGDEKWSEAEKDSFYGPFIEWYRNYTWERLEKSLLSDDE